MPIALFSHDSRAMEPDSHEVVFPFLKVMEFHYLKVQLKHIPWRTYIYSDNPVAAALLSKMAYKPQERVKVKLLFLRMLTRMRLDPARMQLLAGFFEKYLTLNDEEELELQREIIDHFAPEEVQNLMEITTSWHEKGRAQGRQEGLQEGGYLVLKKMLDKKIGVLPPDIEENLKIMSVEQLDILAEQILDITSADDLRRLLMALN